MKNLITLFRWPNLLMISASQVLIQFCILKPQIPDLIFSDFHFLLLVLSTVCISAAGYIINDYYDQYTDKINKPDKAIIGNSISKKKAFSFYWILNTIGVLLAFYLAIQVDLYKLGFIHIVIASLLWLYSSKYKKNFLVGNFLIAFLCTLPILIIWIYNFFAAMAALQMNMIDIYEIGKTYIIAYMGFAFLITIIRELIKDIEDIDGDKQSGFSTAPIHIGIPKTKIIIYAFTVLSILFLGYINYILISHRFTFLFIFLCITVLIPLIFLLIKTIKASKKKDYSNLSLLCKIILLAGILSMQLFTLTLG